MPPEFALTEDVLDSDRHVVAVRGEIDLFTAPELKQKLTDAIEGGKSRIVVDLTDTTFLDSTALGVLIGAVKRLRAGHRQRRSEHRQDLRDHRAGPDLHDPQHAQRRDRRAGRRRVSLLDGLDISADRRNLPWATLKEVKPRVLRAGLGSPQAERAGDEPDPPPVRPLPRRGEAR